jgi:hypothetical protein
MATALMSTCSRKNQSTHFFARIQAERQVDTAISNENPLAVAILASDTLVHRQPVYRDVQIPCNSRDTADRGLVAGLLFSASCLRPGATIARWMTASVPFEVP